MSDEAKQTPGGTWVRIKEDKRGTTHIDVYDKILKKNMVSQYIFVFVMMVKEK